MARRRATVMMMGFTEPWYRISIDQTNIKQTTRARHQSVLASVCLLIDLALAMAMALGVKGAGAKSRSARAGGRASQYKLQIFIKTSNTHCQSGPCQTVCRP